MTHLVYTPAVGCEDVDPHHRPVPVIGTATNPHLTHPVRKMVLPVSGSIGLDERSVEVGIREACRLCPVGPSGWFVVDGVEIDFEDELCGGVMVGADPVDEQAQRSRVGVSKREIRARLRSLSPVESDACDEESIIDVLSCEGLGVDSDSLDFVAPFPLGVDRNPKAGSGTRPVANRCDLLWRESDVSAPIRQGALRHGDQFTNLAIREAKAAESFAQFGTFLSVELIPLIGPVE